MKIVKALLLVLALSHHVSPAFAHDNHGTCPVMFSTDISGETPEMLLEKLAESCDGSQTPVLFINSPGGDNLTARGLYDLLPVLGIETTVSLGQTISAAVTIFLAGEKRYISPNSVLLVHEGYTYPDQARTDASLLREHLNILKEDDEHYSRLIAERTGMTYEQARALMNERRPIGAEEAVKLGFAHAIWDGQF